MQELVRLRTRPSRDGRRFTYFLDYVDEDGNRKRTSLGHADRRKAERQRAQKERERRMGIVAPQSMKLSDFAKDSLQRTGDQIRQSTRQEYASAMAQFIDVIGNMDYQRVEHKHGETFIQARLDHGDSPATVAKKIRHLKRFFQLAVDGGQLDAHPLRRIRQPKSSKKKIRVYKVAEYERILRAARELTGEFSVRWDRLVSLALTTGMRKSEMLNSIWCDIDFKAKKIEVTSKVNTERTWEWKIKDTDRRTLPLTDELIALLSSVQAELPEGYPYVLVPPCRYDQIQELRRRQRWGFTDARTSVIHGFTSKFDKILERASVSDGRFHDLRNTALTHWFANGLKEFEVMRLAGHAKFETTHKFYLAVADDLVDRARAASVRILPSGFGTHLARTRQTG